MTIIILLILASLSVAVLFLTAFLWSVKSGQYDDLYGPSVRLLFDDKKGKSAGDKTDAASRVSEEPRS